MIMQKKLFSKPAFVCLFAVVCCELWGSAFPFIKIGYSIFEIGDSDYSSQILFAGIRFALAGVLTIFAGSAVSKKVLVLRKSSVGRVAVLALFQTVLQYIFFYIGLANTQGTKASVINSSSVFFAVIISALLFRQDKITVKKAVGCIIGFSGVVIVNFSSDGFTGNFSVNGDGFIILSSLSYAFSTVFLKKFSERENPALLSGYQFFFGGAVMILFGLLTGGSLGKITAKGIFLLIYLAFVSAAAYTLWGILLKYNDVSRVAVYGFMTPVFGCLLSALFLREELSQSAAQLAISLILVCIGIYAVNSKNKKEKE